MVPQIVFVILIHFPLTAYGSLFFRYAPESLYPTNEHFLQDVHPDTCSRFEIASTPNQIQYTHFRFQAFNADVGDINITITGSNLECGQNLRVSPLSRNMSQTWLGRWTCCQLVNIEVIANKEACSYWCKSPGYTAELQFFKFPRSSDESRWEACQINVTANYPDYHVCSDSPQTHNGVYHINLRNTEYHTDVYCDMETDGGGWTVLMRRMDGSVDFDREWDDCKYGFGSLSGEFWAGLETMHRITTAGRTYTLRIELRSFSGEFIFAEYSSFWIGPEPDNYRLHVDGYLENSTAGDSLASHNGAMFSTASRDNDDIPNSCGQEFHAPWWYTRCFAALLTTPYGEYPDVQYGIIWYDSWGSEKFGSFVRMMIRPNT